MSGVLSTTVDSKGRIRIPSSILQELVLEPGTELLVLVEDGAIMLLTREAGVRYAQRLVAESLGGYKGSLVDELIACRRHEAARD